jgi:hypothetical protein
MVQELPEGGLKENHGRYGEVREEPAYSTAQCELHITSHSNIAIIP